MMSTQTNNCRHVGFQSWESQTCETLAFQKRKKKTFLLDTLFKISLHFLWLSPSLHCDGFRLVGMLTLDARLKRIALRNQLTLDTLYKAISAFK